MCVPGNKRSSPVTFNLHQYAASRGIRAFNSKSQLSSSVLSSNNGSNFDAATIPKTTQVPQLVSKYDTKVVDTKVAISTTTVPEKSNVNNKRVLDLNTENNEVIRRNESIVTHGNINTPSVICSSSSSSRRSSESSSTVEFKELSTSEIMEIENEVPIHERKRRKRKPQVAGKTATLKDRQFVKHKYHDHASEPPPEGYISPTEDSLDDSSYDNKIEKKNRSMSALSLLPFPFKLHKMLDTVAKDGYESVISWQPHGRSFVIHKPKAFANIILSHYFNQTKLTSFQRQLNLYGFLRISDGRDAGGYYHEFFLRGRIHLCEKMTRVKVKGTGYKAASNPQEEPDFYAMQPVRPLSEIKEHITPSLPPFMNILQPEPSPLLPPTSFSLQQNLSYPQHSPVFFKPDPNLSSPSSANGPFYPQDIFITCPSPPRLPQCPTMSPILSSAIVPTQSYNESHPIVSKVVSSNPIEESFALFNDDADGTSMVDDILELFSCTESSNEESSFV